MGNYKVYRTNLFNRKIQDFSGDFQRQINNIEDQLEENPYVGKPLGTRWFREKRIEGYRVYYLIYEDLKAVYIITLSGKKDQQRTINTIKHFICKYREEIEDMVT